MKKYLAVLTLLAGYAGLWTLSAQTAWQAPPEADALQNPLAGDEASVKKGEKIYRSLCAACHGATGKGDVPSMQSLNPKPTDLTSEAVQKQSDGAIFWKISEGRGMMASYKNMLTEEERWSLVNYIRSLGDKSSGAVKDKAQSAGEKEKKKKQNTNTSKAARRQEKASASYVDAFPFTVLINAKTTHIMHPKGFGLNIQHRFGTTKFDEGFVTNFMGLDLAANMRFAFEIPYNDRLMFEIGRTRYGKFYDMGFKYLILRQTADDRIPVSVAIYENVAVTTEKPPVYSENATFANGTLFEYKFYHRLSYDNELIMSRRFGDRFSAQLTFQLVWRNLMPYSAKPRFKNYVFALPLALRYRIGFSQAVSLEIMPNNQPKNFPVSMAYEVASSGNHVFQITVTNSDRFLAQNLYTVPTFHYDKDGFILGFNLIRYF
ncbi:MAG: c-type cytochrome [Chlorobi bacterium]|nr:c-type cytochrome [Chlorobiota bacterium]